MTTPASVPPASHPLRAILDNLSGIITALGAVLVALVPLLLPDRLVPEQLSVLRPTASLLFIVAFLVGWSYRRRLWPRRAAFLWAAIVALLGLAILQVQYVKELPGLGREARSEYHLIGYKLTPRGRVMVEEAGVGREAVEMALRQIGPDAIPVLYGSSYQALALAYALATFVFVFSVGLALTMSARDIQTRRRGRRTASVAVALLVSAHGLIAQTPAQRALLDSATARRERGVAARSTGVRSDLRRALDHFRAAESLYARGGDSVRAARHHGIIGVVFSDLGQHDSALAYFNRALVRQSRLRDTIGEGRTRLNRGRSLYATGRPSAAWRDYQIALRLARQGKDTYDEATVLNNMGWQLQDSARRTGQRRLFDSAAYYYRLMLGAGVEDTSMIARTHLRLASLHEDLSQPDSAIAHYEESIRLFRQTNDPTIADALFGIGSVYGSLRRHEPALAHLLEASEIYSALEDSLGKGKTDTRILAVEYDRVDMMIERGASPEAIARALGRADSIQKVIGRLAEPLRQDSIVVTNADSVSARRLAALARTDSALAGPLALLMLARSTRGRLPVGSALEAVAHVFIGRDSTRLALAYLDSALSEFRAAKDRFGEVRVLTTTGWVNHRLAGRLARARSHYAAAATARAKISAAAGSDPNRVSLHEQDVNLFSAWALASLADTGSPRSAAIRTIGVLELGRAQALLALVERPSRSVVPKDLGPGAGERLVRATNGVPRLVYWLAEDTLLVLLLRADGSITVARQPLIRPSMIQRLVGRTAVYNTLARRSVGRDSVSENIRAYRTAIADTTAARDSATAVAGRALTTLLLPPAIRRQLPTAGEIVVIPFGGMGFIPFAALPDTNGEPLGARYAVRYAPSLAMLNIVNTRSNGRRPAAFPSRPLIAGNVISPPVPNAITGKLMTFGRLAGAESTAHWLARRFDTSALVGTEATEALVRTRLSTADLIDLETHGYAYSESELARNSFITLTEGDGHDGVLTVAELLDELPRLRANLVVLSACETGLGDPREAEGVVGLARAVLARGSAGVLISLWRVDDRVTGILIRGFYDAWLGPNRPTKAEALRLAQEAVRKDYPNPRYWAAFQLVGR
jgi:CHAT domain-containing protein/tetratricopeptide (TPR) repeat protein